jgi:hypothetical protein
MAACGREAVGKEVCRQGGLRQGQSGAKDISALLTTSAFLDEVHPAEGFLADKVGRHLSPQTLSRYSAGDVPVMRRKA